MSRIEVSTPLELQAAGRRVGAYRWIESQLFVLLGAWVNDVPEPHVKLLLDQQSFEHAWHADLWTARLPSQRLVDTDALIRPPNEGVATVFRMLLDEASSTDTCEKLTAVFRVLLPRLVSEYSAHLDRALSAGGEPTQRALRLVLSDELAAWRAGETQLEELLVDRAAVERSTDFQRQIEGMLVQSGGLVALFI